MTATGHEGYGDPLALMLLRHASERPDDLVARDDREALTYGQLLERVAATAGGLSALGVGPGDRVALRLPNSVRFLSVALACLWLGATFVPCSVDDPVRRVERILADSGASCLVSDDDVSDSAGISGPETVNPAELAAVGHAITERSQDRDLDAYIIYTSGTTGAPKGVRIPVRSFGWSISTIAAMLGLDCSTRSLCVSPFHFDGSYATLFPTLVAGGCLVIPRREQLLFVRPFISAILDHDITHTSCSPSFLRLLLASPKLPALGDSCLRTMGLGGEAILAEDLAALWASHPELRVFNFYGPTEATIEVTSYELDHQCTRSGVVPIGRPHPGVSFHLVDPENQVIEGSDEIGEIMIGGKQLMRGYWGDPALTHEVLRDDIVPGEIVYKTGDLAHRDDEGLYLFQGRIDDVVKRHGVRISLGEIDRTMRRLDGVSGAICLAVEIDGRLGIAAFVEGAPDLTVSGLLQSSRAYLPGNMLPDKVFLLDELPVTSSGKIDRNALRAVFNGDGPHEG